MNITNIFSSIQGEGIYIGYRQIFIRFAGCHLACDYCDENTSDGKIMTKEEVVETVKNLNKSFHHSISLTGGEPLLQVDEIKNLIPNLTLPIYLETSATLPDHLKEIYKNIDIFSFDFKPGYEDEFLKSLDLVKDENVFIKYIVLRETTAKEINDAAKLISSLNPDIPLVLQPVTPHKKIKVRPYPDDLLAYEAIARRNLNDVRVIPQTHKMLGLM